MQQYYATIQSATFKPLTTWTMICCKNAFAGYGPNFGKPGQNTVQASSFSRVYTTEMQDITLELILIRKCLSILFPGKLPKKVHNYILGGFAHTFLVIRGVVPLPCLGPCSVRTLERSPCRTRSASTPPVPHGRERDLTVVWPEQNCLVKCSILLWVKTCAKSIV